MDTSREPLATHSPHWNPGDCVALRYLTRTGQPGMTWPFRVIEDGDDRVALFIPAGASYMRWAPAAGTRQLVAGPWRRNVLRLMFPGAPYSVWLQWEPDGSFRGYYVNFEEPYRRTPIGFDTNDHTLDMVVDPDFRWRWKDSDEFDQRVASGIYSHEFATHLRESAAAVPAAIERHQPPFDDTWAAWRPDPAWPIPELPAGWDTVAPVPWERRQWAYVDAR